MGLGRRPGRLGQVRKRRDSGTPGQDGREVAPSARGAGAPRRDRHRRRYRGPLTWPPQPSTRTRSQAFDDAVLASVEALEARWSVSLAHIDIGVEEVPPSEPSAWEDAVPLGRAFPAEGKHRARMVLYRLPIQTRSVTPIERDALIDHVVRTQVAGLIGHPLDDEDDL